MIMKDIVINEINRPTSYTRAMPSTREVSAVKEQISVTTRQQYLARFKKDEASYL